MLSIWTSLKLLSFGKGLIYGKLTKGEKNDQNGDRTSEPLFHNPENLPENLN